MDKKMYQNELEQFRKISSHQDFNLLFTDKISYLDYYRLDYLLIALGMVLLELDFAQRHESQFRERRKQHEAIGCVDLDTLDRWETDFLNNITDKHIRNKIQKRFKED